MGFLAKLGAFVAGMETLAEADDVRTAAMRLAASTDRAAITFTWLAFGGCHTLPWSGEDPSVWRRVWTAMFRQIGYCCDGVPAALPERPVLVFRGCGPEPGAELGMSWSPAAEVAEDYARMSARRCGHGRVYAYRAQPVELLAFLTYGGLYPELVVDISLVDAGDVELVDEIGQNIR
jgi:hypothetical protein